jgi:serine protease Do
MKTFRILSINAVAALFLAGSLAPAAPDARAQASLKLTAIVMAIPAGTLWLKLRIGSTLCIGPAINRTWDRGREKQELSVYSDTFKTELERAGYKVVTPGENLFDRDAGSTDYEVAGVITAAQVEGCISKGGFGIDRGAVRGESSLNIDWQVYSPLRKQVVARISTSGKSKLDNSVPGGEARLVVAAFGENARALASSADFRAAVAGAGPLTSDVLTPGKQDKLFLNGSLNASRRPVADLVGSVVTVLTGTASGSGDLISNDGYILTNAHVVGDEKSVRVRWSDGLETVAEVVRAVKTRDVAIIKTNSRDREPLSIKRGSLAPGARVYAIGSPLGKDYQGTVSSGVVSATRTIEGLRYIQSDVPVSHGSSGGALLNETGAMIGITVSGVDDPDAHGLNFFIPIGDAMDFLNLEQK